VTVRAAESTGPQSDDLTDGVRAESEKAEGLPIFWWLVRMGFVARAITYGVIGGLALALAFGAGTGGVAPNQQGALTLIGQNVIGRVVLVVIAAGLLAYAVWKLTQATFGNGPEGGGSPKAWERISNFAGGVAYVAFFLVAVRALTGSAGNSSSQPKRAAAGVLGWPAGQVLVAIGGVALVAVSAYQVYDALSGQFATESKTAHMGGKELRTFMLIGRIGISSRALAFALVGYFLLKSAITYDPAKAVGLDGALARLHSETLGPELVGLVGVGLLVFAIYSLFEGRYRRL